MNKDNIVALGIDQGIANMGYCVISVDRANKAQPVVISSGVLETNNTALMQNRIQYLFNELDGIIKKHPEICIMGTEALFVNSFKSGRNKSAAIVSTNMITGAILLLGARHNILVKQYTPGSVKKYITGAGDASKVSVEVAMDEVIQRNNIKIRADHQSDAIAIAWTSSMDVVENGLESLNAEALTPKPSKRSKRAKIVQTKEFLYHAYDVVKTNKRPEHIPYYLDKLGKNPLGIMEEQSITGRFKKGKIMITTQGESDQTVMVGVEVGKKCKAPTVVVSEGTWYCVELKNHDEKNINRAFCNLSRKLAKNSSYMAKPAGRIMEIISERVEGECSVQLYIEVVATA